MYNYIFYVLYKHNLKDGKGSARYNGSLIVGISIFVHLLLLLSIVKKTAPNIVQQLNILFKNKAFIVIILFLIVFAVFYYYNSKRIEMLVALKEADGKIIGYIDVVKVISTILIPIILIGLIYKI